MTPRSLLALVFLAHVARAAAAPPGPSADWETRAAALRETLAATPDDTRARCELGFALVQGRRFAEAREELDVAVSALGDPSDDKLKKRLGACLYNRALAARGLGDSATERADLTRSLAVRPNPTVAAALAALPEAVPDAAFAEPAFAACSVVDRYGSSASCSRVDTITRPATTPAGCSGAWAVVTLDTSPYAERYAVRVVDGRATVVQVGALWDWGMAGHPTWSLETRLVRIAPGVCALVVDDTEAGTRACDVDADAEEGRDYREVTRTTRRVVVMDPERGSVALEAPLTSRFCDEDWSLEVTFDGRGGAMVKKIDGQPPRHELGFTRLVP